MAGGGIAQRTKQTIERLVRNLAKDWSLGFAFPRAYAKAAKASPVDQKKVLLVDLKSSTMPDAFSVIFPYMQDALGFDVRFVGLEQQSGAGWLAYYKRCFELMHDMATAKYIFLCDACDMVSCVSKRPETKVVQLWHACGAFKKWGVSTADKKFGGTRKEVERHPFYKNLDLVTVSSPEVEWAYREAMMLEDTPEVVQAVGVSRTDVFFDAEFLDNAHRAIAEAVPQIEGKKVALYAPTFRGRTNVAEGPDALDMRVIKDALAGEWVLLVKHHPYVKCPPAIPDDCQDFAFMVNELPIDQLLCVADACISDYSSLVFEYSIFNRPMVFFAYDLDDYGDWRGFYYDYDELTPGPVVKMTDELIDYFVNIDDRFDSAQVAAFCDKFMSACDGHATERICDFIMS